MLENVTVIIPAHNRPNRLQRLIDYYSNTGIQILIPDSSDRKFTGRLEAPGITYIHRPRMHFFNKIHEVLPLIDTDYVLYCADDDFTVPAAIKQITDFLDANPDYSIAQGHYLTFTPQGDKISFSPRYIRNFDNRITGSDAMDRMMHEKGMYASMLYGVTRSDIFKRIYSYCFDETGNMRFSNLFLAEEFFNHAVLIHGKYATLPCFYSARERIKGSATETTIPVSVIKNSPKYADEYNGFIRALALMLAEHDGIATDEAEKRIRLVSSCPKASGSVTFKRKVNQILSSHKVFAPLAQLSEWRYHQKGLKAVKHLPSYPCTFSTPEKEEIIRAIHSQPLD